MSVTTHPPEVDLHRKATRALVAIALLAGLAACSPEPIEPSTPPPSPSVSVSATPTAGLSPDMDALYAEAERILRLSWTIQEDRLKAGDFDTFPPELEAILADPYLQSMRTAFELYRAEDLRMSPDTSTGLTVRPSPGRVVDGSDLAVQACIDMRSAPVLDANGNVFSQGGLILQTYFFKTEEGVTKMFATQGDGEVAQCPFE